MSEMKTPSTIAFEPSGQRWITSVASQPILLPPMHQAGQTHCNLAWLRTMACNKLWRNSTHSLEASSQSQGDWGLGNFRRLCFQSSSPFCWSSVPEYLVDHPPWIQSAHTLMELGAGTLFSLWPEGLSNVGVNDTPVFLLNEYIVELNPSNFNILNQILNWIFLEIVWIEK